MDRMKLIAVKDVLKSTPREDGEFFRIYKTPFSIGKAEIDTLLESWSYERLNAMVETVVPGGKTSHGVLLEEVVLLLRKNPGVVVFVAHTDAQALMAKLDEPTVQYSFSGAMDRTRGMGVG